MGSNTKIEWATHTFNAWRGCEKIAPGCDNCYAAAFAKRNPRILGEWGPSGTRIVASEDMWQLPTKWNKDAARMSAQHDRHQELGAYVRPRVFCNSIADMFEDWKGNIHSPHLVIDEPCPENGFQHGKFNPIMWHRDDIGICEAGGTTIDHSRGDRLATLTDVRQRLFSLIDDTPNLDWLLLTKRPENIRKMWPSADLFAAKDEQQANPAYWPNVWLGTSIATQEDAEHNIPELLKSCDLSPVLFLSIEPMLEGIDISRFLRRNTYSQWANGGGPNECRHGIASGLHCNNCRRIDWVIVGGESGHNARPMHPDWVRSIRDQCQEACVPFFFKQWGEWLPFSDVAEIDASVSDKTPVCCVKSDGRVFRPYSYAEHAPCHQMARVGKAAAGRLLDGREWNELPEVKHA